MTDQSFSRDKRLLTPRHFKTVFDGTTGKVPGKQVLLLARENQLDHPRIGFVIAKKSVRLAVQRNRLKRVIRDSFRRHQEQLVGWDIIVLARKGMADQDNDELHAHFVKLWKRLSKLRKNTPALAEPSDDRPHA
ncbi:ribonuclease P protein component [Atopomonas sediminilitoris]|uniref:ribonuclease P protein component n=1 Tax=Atopomonas sediminilitoris TaxID=2919919 RepID=UPI001F4E3D60|nr:ribonuclease P protein component [Atopomonas sediminilitoris]